MLGKASGVRPKTLRFCQRLKSVCLAGPSRAGSNHYCAASFRGQRDRQAPQRVGGSGVKRAVIRSWGARGDSDIFSLLLGALGRSVSPAVLGACGVLRLAMAVVSWAPAFSVRRLTAALVPC